MHELAGILRNNRPSMPTVSSTANSCDRVLPSDDSHTASRETVIESLYEQHATALTRMVTLVVGNQDDARDIVQEAFTRFLTSKKRVRDIENAPAYLRSISFNLARNGFRKNSVAQRYAETIRTNTESSMHASSVSPEQHAQDNQQKTTIMTALQKLSTRQRECVVLRFYGDFSESEIADALDISKGSVKTHTSRGLLALQALLGGEVHE